MTQEKPRVNGGRRPGAGRKTGTRLTEPSTLVRRVRDAEELSQEAFAREYGPSLRTIANYENKSIIPISGDFRTKIEKAAKRLKVSIEEPTA